MFMKERRPSRKSQQGTIKKMKKVRGKQNCKTAKDNLSRV